MSLKKLIYTVNDETSRDNGRSYVITEMAAIPAEKWAARVLLALTRAGVDLPEGALTGGWASIPGVMMVIGVKGLAGLSWFDAEPLLDEMLTCVTVQPRANAPDIVHRLRTEDIEEISTLIRLRGEILKLHYDFSKAAPPLKSKKSRRARRNSSSTQTSPTAQDS